MSHSRWTKARLQAELKRRNEVSAALARRPCPNGHRPDNPECNMMCWITNIAPLPTPFLDHLPKVKTNALYHAWINDDLKPNPDPRKN